MFDPDDIIYHAVRPYEVYNTMYAPTGGYVRGTEIIAEYKGVFSLSRINYNPPTRAEFQRIEQSMRERQP